MTTPAIITTDELIRELRELGFMAEPINIPGCAERLNIWEREASVWKVVTLDAPWSGSTAAEAAQGIVLTNF